MLCVSRDVHNPPRECTCMGAPLAHGLLRGNLEKGRVDSAGRGPQKTKSMTALFNLPTQSKLTSFVFSSNKKGTLVLL